MKQRKHNSFGVLELYLWIRYKKIEIFYAFQGISLKEYIEISSFSYTMLSPPPVLHNFLLAHYLLPRFTLIF